MFPKITKLLTSTIEEGQILGFLLLKKYKWLFNTIKYFEFIIDMLLLFPTCWKILTFLIRDFEVKRISSLEFIYFYKLKSHLPEIDFDLSDYSIEPKGSVTQRTPNIFGKFVLFLYFKFNRNTTDDSNKSGIFKHYF